MKKKLLLTSLFICIGILLFGVFDVSAYIGTYENFNYIISDDEVTITGLSSNEFKYITIPEEIDGYP
ncbi:MAG: hypothetical protein IJD36_06665, partial [Clostridia bacterium]|nr:hypothetical protein [Clostridia bacterium]